MDKEEKLEGIGGWLILPTIGLFLVAGLFSFLAIGYGLIIETSIDLLLFLIFILMAGISIYTLILEFRKSKSFPTWFIFYLWFSVFVVIMLSITDGDYSEVLGIIIFSIIWTWYTNVSIRVKNTFKDYKKGLKNKMEKEKINWKWFLIVLSIFIIIIISFIYLTDNENSGVYEEDNQIIGNLSKNLSSKDEIKDNFSNVTELHWTHMPITYKIENKEECNVKLKERIESAFNKIQSETETFVSFKETNETPDIVISCKPYYYEEYGSDEYVGHFDVTYGLAGPDFIDEENRIINATITFYGAGLVCGTGYPATEVHEILHTFGFGHDYGIIDVMRPDVERSSGDCKVVKIDDKYISCLKKIYSNGRIVGDCSNIIFLKFCKEGYFLGYDDECHEECEVGYIVGDDYLCYEECGEGYYCIEGYTCLEGECY